MRANTGTEANQRGQVSLGRSTVADDYEVSGWPCGQGRAKAMLVVLGCDLCLLVRAHVEDTCTYNNHCRIHHVAADQRDAPQHWQDVIKESMGAIGFKASVCNPSVHDHTDGNVFVVVHADDFRFCRARGGPSVVVHLSQEKDSKTKTVLGANIQLETMFLTRVLSRSLEGFEVESGFEYVRKLL